MIRAVGVALLFLGIVFWATTGYMVAVDDTPSLISTAAAVGAFASPSPPERIGCAR